MALGSASLIPRTSLMPTLSNIISAILKSKTFSYGEISDSVVKYENSDSPSSSKFFIDYPPYSLPRFSAFSSFLWLFYKSVIFIYLFLYCSRYYSVNLLSSLTWFSYCLISFSIKSVFSLSMSTYCLSKSWVCYSFVARPALFFLSFVISIFAVLA